MLEPRSDFVALTYENSTFIMGGCIGNQSVDPITGMCPAITNTFNRYDLNSNSWTVLPSPRHNRTQYSGAIVGTKLYYIGGRDHNGDLLGEVDVFDIESQTWSTLPDQNGVTLRSNSAAFVYGTTIYVVGGYDENYDSLKSVITLNTAVSNTFATGLIPDKPTDSGDCGSVTIGDYAYVFNGFSSTIPDGFCHPRRTFERLDLVNRSWTTIGSTIYARGLPASAVINGKLYLFGGEGKQDNCTNGNAKSYPVSFLEQYDPSTNRWSDGGAVGSNRFRFSGTSYGNLTLVFSFGGQGVEDDGLDLSTDADNFFPVLQSVHAVYVGDQGAFSVYGTSTLLVSIIMSLCVALITMMH
jgi:N-acetylneuraminic acid mutarotase